MNLWRLRTQQSEEVVCWGADSAMTPQLSFLSSYTTCIFQSWGVTLSFQLLLRFCLSHLQCEDQCCKTLCSPSHQEGQLELVRTAHTPKLSSPEAEAGRWLWGLSLWAIKNKMLSKKWEEKSAQLDLVFVFGLHEALSSTLPHNAGITDIQGTCTTN